VATNQMLPPIVIAVTSTSPHCSGKTEGLPGAIVRRLNRRHMQETVRRMQEAFGIVIFVVVGLGAVVALFTFLSSGKSYDEIGKGGFYDEAPRATGPGSAPTSAAGLAERDDEIRQMLGARNARRVARGQEPLDVESELAELTRQRIDPELVQEIRELVEGRNARRVRAGKEPLDVEAEIARQVAEFEAQQG